MITIDEYISELKKEIKSKKITQIELAKRLKTSQSNISFIMNGRGGTVAKFRKIEKCIKEW